MAESLKNWFANKVSTTHTLSSSLVPQAPPPPSEPYTMLSKTPLNNQKSPRDHEIEEALKNHLPLLPVAEPLDHTAVKRLHWQTVEGQHIVSSVWHDVLLANENSDTDCSKHLNALITDTASSAHSESIEDFQRHVRWRWDIDSNFSSMFAKKTAVKFKTLHSGSADRAIAACNKSSVNHNIADSTTVSKPIPVQKVEIIDARRAYNVSISLSRFKMKHHQIRDALLSFDDQTLNAEALDVIYDILPNTDEIKQVLAYDGDPELLRDVERFFLTMNVPGLMDRVKFFIFYKSFSQTARSIDASIELVSTAFFQLRKSPEIKTYLGIVLRFGNYLNAQNKQPQAYGFHISTLLMLRSIKSVDNKSNLLNYIVNYIDTHSPETHRWYIFCQKCGTASQIENAYLVAEVKQMLADVARLGNFIQDDALIQKSANPLHVPVPDKIIEFHKYALLRIDKLYKNLEALQQQHREISEYFLAEGMTWEDFFKVWSVAAQEYADALEENELMREHEERKFKQAAAVEKVRTMQMQRRSMSMQAQHNEGMISCENSASEPQFVENAVANTPISCSDLSNEYSTSPSQLLEKFSLTSNNRSFLMENT